jgi:hypothetical protein
MTNRVEMTEISQAEMLQVDGVMLAINFTKIEFKYTPYDDQHKV